MAASDRQRYRAAARVVGGVDAGHPTTAGIAATQRVEVEPGLTHRVQPAATGGTRHGRARTVADGERVTELGIGRMQHRERERRTGNGSGSAPRGTR
jgi:hypothetical protein